MREVGVPCGSIWTVDQTFADPQVQHFEMTRPVDHPKRCAIKIVGQAINMTRAPESEKLRATPISASTPKRCCDSSATTTLQ
jgi:crotonobetainyl-CoA:carnitine CoA-transferase CaiB-like acyl-CoA transferase